MTDINAMRGPELVSHFNSMADAVGKKPVKKFRTLAEARKRCVDIEAEFSKKQAKPTNSEKKPKKGQFGNFKIELLKEENPRNKSSTVHKRFEEMKAYLKAHPNCTLKDVIENTTYRRIDFIWDSDRGTVRKV